MVGDVLRAPEVPRAVGENPDQRLDGRAMPGSGGGKIQTGAGAAGHRQEQAAFRAKALDEGGRRKAHFAGHVGEGELSRTQLADDLDGGGQDVRVRPGPGSGAHPGIINEGSLLT